MEDGFCWTGVMDVKNGLSAPLYAEGQLVRAADLTLDRSAHDQELWRLRRYLHGWGIVAGLVVNLGEDQVSVSAGYGICPSGEEVFLADEVVIIDLVAQITEACGPGAESCALDEAEARRVAETGIFEAWLIAAPIVTLADPRPAWPADCSHPGNHLAPARACGGVRLGLACEAPPHHVMPARTCEEMREILCRGGEIYLPETHPAPGLLVLGKLGWNGKTLSLETSMRRRLLPVSILQDFVTGCGCREAEKIVEHDDITDPIVVEPEEPKDEKPPKHDRKPDKYDWVKLAEAAKAHEKALAKAKLIPDRGDPVMTQDEAEFLAASGLSVEEVLSTGSAEVAEKTGLTEARIDAIKESIERVKDRTGRPEF
jgi:hypothetical protein